MFLERWTIDQVLPEAVGVARARYIREVTADTPEALAEQVRAIELAAFTPDDWRPEVLTVLGREALMRQLAERSSAAGLAARIVAESDDPRPLFEGQVFWVLTATRLPDTRDGRPIVPPDSPWFLKKVGARRAARAAAPEIGPGRMVDVTQAARAAVKQEYQAAVATPPE
ncbi:MAG: hypothetical protein HYX53_15775 [Chloroflexi bacterium]|nr:hypothetical protein [Chloroflexota bacterium]